MQLWDVTSAKYPVGHLKLHCDFYKNLPDIHDVHTFCPVQVGQSAVQFKHF